MTYKQLIDAGKSNMLEIGAHTRTHLFLDQFPKETQMQEILESKRILEELTGKQVRYFAYPGGEYNADTLDVITDAGFDAALALIPKRISQDPTLELGRIGIYSRSLMKVWMKAIGVADIARRLGLRVG
jgi:peptidoglycan/xylan/chitin deacetylase (PgdA/CDA1 family)